MKGGVYRMLTGVGDLNITVPVKVTLADKAWFWRERLGGASILQ